MGSARRFLGVLLVTVGLLACGEGEPVSRAPDAGAGITGVVFKGPVSGATVSAYALSNAFGRVRLLGSTTTGEEGAFELPPLDHAGPVLLVASAGSYEEEAVAGATVRLGASELTAVVIDHEPARGGAFRAITPISHLEVALAGFYVRVKGKSFEEALNIARNHLEWHFGDLSWRGVVPADVTRAYRTQLDAAAKAGLLLAALSWEARSISENAGLEPAGEVTAMTLLESLYADLSWDGLFDGQGKDGQLILPRGGVVDPLDLRPTAYALGGNTVRADLALGMLRFVESPRNASGLRAVDVEAFAQELGARSDPALFRGSGQQVDARPPAVRFSVHFAQDPDGSASGPVTPGGPVAGLVTVTAEATDLSGVRELSVAVNGSPLVPVAQEGTASRFAGTWDTRGGADGPLTFTATATDGASPPNTGWTDFNVVVDNTAPSITLDGAFDSYQDEQGMELAADYHVPVASEDYLPRGPRVALSEGQTVHKAFTRLSWGPSPPAGVELEGANVYNTPALRFAATFNPATDSAIQSATYDIQVSCSGCPAFPVATGALVPSARTSPAQVFYLLPLAVESVPALADARLVAPAILTIRATFTDAAGNRASTSPLRLQFEVIGPPLAWREDTEYPSVADPRSIYAHALAGGAYADLWGTGLLRVRRFVVTNPAPVAVPLAVALSGSTWSVTETWEDDFFNVTGASYRVDGSDFQPVYFWSSANAAPNYPCGGWAGTGATHYPRHTKGSATPFECVPLPAPSPRVGSAPSQVAAGAGGVAAWLDPESGGNETRPAASWSTAGAAGYWVPAASGGMPGQLVLYAVRERVAAPNAYTFQDLGNGPRIQTWREDFWTFTGATKVCGTGLVPPLCAQYQATRNAVALTAAQESFSGTLSVSTYARSADTGAPYGTGQPLATVSVATAVIH